MKEVFKQEGAKCVKVASPPRPLGDQNLPEIWERKAYKKGANNKSRDGIVSTFGRRGPIDGDAKKEEKRTARGECLSGQLRGGERGTMAICQHEPDKK